MLKKPYFGIPLPLYLLQSTKKSSFESRFEFTEVFPFRLIYSTIYFFWIIFTHFLLKQHLQTISLQQFQRFFNDFDIHNFSIMLYIIGSGMNYLSSNLMSEFNIFIVFRRYERFNVLKPGFISINNSFSKK